MRGDLAVREFAVEGERDHFALGVWELAEQNPQVAGLGVPRDLVRDAAGRGDAVKALVAGSAGGVRSVAPRNVDRSVARSGSLGSQPGLRRNGPRRTSKARAAFMSPAGVEPTSDRPEKRRRRWSR